MIGKNALMWILAVLGGLVFLFGIRLFVLGKQSRTMTPDVGLQSRQLKPCGPKPNCACSFHTDENFRVEALVYTRESVELVAALQTLMTQWGAKLITQEGNYFHYTVQTKLFGFVDDVEFLLDPSAKKLDFRSASRVGHSDLGVNKKRLALIRAGILKFL